MTVVELRLHMALGLLPHLSARDRSEIKRTHPDLELWALDRCTLPGNAWALMTHHDVQVIGGVVSSRDTGTLWLAGRSGWTRHAKTVLKIFREIRAAGFRRLECKAYLDNPRAQRFAERAGFERLSVADNLVHYGMAL